jgi:hypothetical protein
MASTSSATSNLSPGNLPTLRTFAETEKCYKNFQILIENLSVLITFDSTDKLTFSRERKVFFVDNKSGSIARKIKGAFNPNYVNMVCNRVFQVLTNSINVVNKIKEKDALAWNELQKVFNLVRPFSNRTGRLDDKLIVKLDLLTAKYTYKEIWSLLKAATIAQMILPIVSENDSEEQSKPFEHIFVKLMENYTEKRNYDFYSRLSGLKQSWPEKIHPLCEAILIRKLNRSEILLPENIKTSVVPQPSSPRQTRRKPSRSRRSQHRPQVPSCSSSPQSENEPKSSPSTEILVNVPPAPPLPVVDQESPQTKKAKTGDKLKRERLKMSSDKVEDFVNSQRLEKIRLQNEESRRRKEAAFNQTAVARAAAKAPELPELSAVITSWDDVQIKTELNKSSVIKDDNDELHEDEFLLVEVSAPVQNVLLRTQSEAELLAPPVVRSPLQRRNSEAIPPPSYIVDFEKALMAKFAKSKQNESDSDDDGKWSDEETKPGLLSRLGSYLGL